MLEVCLDDAHKVVIELDDNDFVHRWVEVFNCAVQHSTVDQTACFAFRISKSQALQKLEQVAQAINHFCKKEMVPLPSASWSTDDYCNRAHLIFEQLSGTYDSPTRFFTLAPKHVKEAIRDLNFYVHVLEQDQAEQDNLWYINFDRHYVNRQALIDQDYDLFQRQVQPGAVYVHYAELGKTHLDLYKDGLCADYQAQKNLHYFAADLTVWLGPEIDYFSTDFESWAHENKIDLQDKKLGLGILPVGRVKDLDTARQFIYNAKKITQLRIYHGQTI
jgi:hypothetical protein